MDIVTLINNLLKAGPDFGYTVTDVVEWLEPQGEFLRVRCGVDGPVPYGYDDDGGVTLIICHVVVSGPGLATVSRYEACQED